MTEEQKQDAFKQYLKLQKTANEKMSKIPMKEDGVPLAFDCIEYKEWSDAQNRALIYIVKILEK